MAEELNLKEESMQDYEKEINDSFKKVIEGDVLKGVVISVTDTEVTLDLGYYTDGIIKVEDFSDDPDFAVKEQVTTGDVLEATVIAVDDGQGHILLSKKEANRVLAWDKLRSLMEEEAKITVKIQGVVKAGVITYVEGIRAFVPASQLSLGYVEDLEEWLLKEIEVKIITVDEGRQKLILSAKEILKEEAEKERKNKISNLQVGLVAEGIVDTIKPYGAFVQLENGLTGLLHVSQICAKRIKTPWEILKEGQKITVKVTDMKDGKLSLSMKALQDVTDSNRKEEIYELEETEEIGTCLGDLFKNIKL
ncbi:S1 RNA-binding domain-containing protein [Anaerosacchariphilus polymeriproducens]|uniref:S1 RNA-binding domain-containing protein n=1 Tax=Anaerosacchariphilus polymeriproducens TaxID=1812858 RepID=A0A371B033_9FIRM|nr:S1 RNA-binding domain-containing protein [Anaerosacchariphilus polymeriproducens]RDU25090.1 S1 RNA-binding domain-containing protein [Anaerosacchariphilus polymeriproducens]